MKMGSETVSPWRRRLRWAAAGLLTLVGLLLIGAVFGSPTLPPGAPPLAALVPVDKDAAGLALSGYDPVAYHQEGAARLGSADVSYRWNGATWLFASDANRQMFVSDPVRYGPLFGGHCAFAASMGKVVPSDPEVWSIVDGRLFLNADIVARGLFRAVPGAGRRAFENWPGAN